MDKKQGGNNDRQSIHRRSVAIVIVTLLIGAGLVYWYWGQPGSAQSATTDASRPIDRIATMDDVLKGNVLAQTYCQACHMLPSPDLLNRKKWLNVFPQMGLRLGIKSHRGESYLSAVKAPDVPIPEKPVMSDEQWQKIIDYYENTAPIALPEQSRPVPIKRELPFFSLKNPSDEFLGKQVLGTYVKIDNSVEPARIFVANGRSNKLFLLNNRLKVIDSVNTAGPVVDMVFDNGDIKICTIGKELGATSDKFGIINNLKINNSGKMSIDAVPLFKDLARPVQILTADVNGDGRTDYVICEFGNMAGELCWMENKGDGTFSKHVVRDMPGAIKVYTDYSVNKSAPDLWALFAQGDEGIYHFINNGKGAFTVKRVLRFPPVYGSSFFEMVDIDHDGFKDIIYTCGDNGDATVVSKPYHGVYVFLNDQHGNYNQKFFYPINGCYKAYARDFDGDGNVDIATASLFTDARQPEEGFVFFKNNGGLNFTPFSLPRDTKFERAVTMDAGDINSDGKPDLLIGNAFFDFGPFGYNVSEPLFFALLNKTK